MLLGSFNSIKVGAACMPLLSIVIPAYNEEESIDHIMPALHDALDPEGIAFEVIFIDDGSADTTFEKIQSLSREADNIRGYRFSRNFGKESAIWAGLQNAGGDCCVVMDSDLQHPPDVLPKLYRLWEGGYQIVEGVKARRGKESFVYKLFSNIFYRLIASLSGLDMRTSSDFKLLDRRVVDELLMFQERNSFFRGLSFWVGFRSTKLEYNVAPRLHGETKWSFFQLLKYALNNIIGFSTAPLQLVSVIGSILIAVSIILAIQTLVRFILGHAMEGFTTTILLILFVGGGLMLSLGIIGLYIAKIYEEVKARPSYIISDSTEGAGQRKI